MSEQTYIEEVTTLKRFWDKVDQTDTCWNWTAGKTKFGYGRFGIGGRKNQRTVFSHRFVIGQHNNPLCVLHTCDNPSCVNPEHLFIGTHLDNTRDCIEKGRFMQKKTIQDHRGIRNPKVKLTERQVLVILENPPISRGGKLMMARYLGVSPSAISHIINRRSWNHLNKKP